jgi:hypothetical protein
MSCVLSLQGRDFDVDRFLTTSALPLPFKVKRKGEPRWPQKPQGATMSFSVLSIVTSESDFNNLKQQIEDTIEYLERNKQYLRHISKADDIEFATLDFGVDLRIDREKLPCHSERLPAKLLLLAGEFGLDIELSLYLPV